MCRTTWPLDPKRSDGWIVYNSKEKEDTLSLEKAKFEATGYFFFSSPPRFLFLCFCSFFSLFFFFSFSYLFFSSFLLLISLPFSLSFLPIFSFLFACLSSFLEQPLIRSKGGNFLPISSNQRCGYHFSILISLFLKSPL